MLPTNWIYPPRRPCARCSRRRRSIWLLSCRTSHSIRPYRLLNAVCQSGHCEPGHKVYPYLLRGLTVERPNQVWAMYITYIPMARGFDYLTVVLDWYSRRVLSWRLSITMDAAFCVETLEDALVRHGRPDIFNTDQGSQFTGAAFTGVLAGKALRSAWTVRVPGATTC